MTALPERGGWEGVTEGTHASPLIGIVSEPLLKTAVSKGLSRLEIGNV